MADREVKKILLRIPPELWEKIQRMADVELRSVNGQIEYLLKEAVKAREKKEPR
jgi:hypothetical protein